MLRTLSINELRLRRDQNNIQLKGVLKIVPQVVNHHKESTVLKKHSWTPPTYGLKLIFT